MACVHELNKAPEALEESPVEPMHEPEPAVSLPPPAPEIGVRAYVPQSEIDPTPLPAARVATGIPARASAAIKGHAFYEETMGLSIALREERIATELLAGNIPSHLRTLQPVRLVATNERGTVLFGVAFAMPDYLAIGSDDDFVRMPMTPRTAQIVADAYGLQIPTSKLVDAAYRAASVKLTPSTMTPSRAMRDNPYLREHERRVKQQLEKVAEYASDKSFVAGHKKDVVLARRLEFKLGRVAIYGWHMPNGEPIQPLSTWHRRSYSDYSHALRLFAPEAIVAGREWSIDDLVRHPTLSFLVSDEGIIQLLKLDTSPIAWAVDEY